MEEKLQIERQPKQTFTWDGAPISRRSFFNRMGAAGLGVAAAAAFGSAGLAGCGGSNNNGLNNGGNNGGGGGGNDPFAALGIQGADVNIRALNYALSLEIIEADLYKQALNQASQRPLGQALDATPPPSGSLGAYRLLVPAGGLSGPFATAGFLYLVQFAYVEAAHRNFLQNALGAAAAPLRTSGFAFPNGPGADLKTILTNILPLEETGVRAYLGATPYITDKLKLQTAGTIYSTEARHSAAVSYLISATGESGPTRMAGDQEVAPSADEKVFEKFLEPSVVVQRVQAYFTQAQPA